MTTMNARERVLAVINHERPDRVPTDLWATAEVMDRLRAHFGAEADLHARLHIDGIKGVWPRYIGPPLPECPQGETVDFWGMRWKPMQYATGSYQEQSHCPLAAASTIDDLERYPWPNPDWFDYAGAREEARAAHETHAVIAGGMSVFYQHNLLRGLEASLTDPHDDEGFTRYLLQRIGDFFQEFHQRLFESCAGLIDISSIADDYGCQTGLLIGMETFRTFYRAHLQRFADLCRQYGLKVFHHDDGGIRPLIPELIALGVDILNPVQANCPGMEMTALKRDFGDRLCFHGGIDNQDILPHGTPDAVRAEVRRAIDALAGDGTGYILAPCHNLQAVTPVENIVAMYDEAWNYGRL